MLKSLVLGSSTDFEALIQGDFPKGWAEARLQKIEEISEVVINRYAEKKEFLAQIRKVKAAWPHESCTYADDVRSSTLYYLTRGSA